MKIRAPQQPWLLAAFNILCSSLLVGFGWFICMDVLLHRPRSFALTFTVAVFLTASNAALALAQGRLIVAQQRLLDAFRGMISRA